MKMLFLFLMIPFKVWPQQSSSNREKMAELFTLREQVKKRVFEKSRKEQDVQRVHFELSKQTQKIQDLKSRNLQLTEAMQNRVSFLYKKRKVDQAGGILSLDRSQNYLKKVFYTQYFNRQDKQLSHQLLGTQKEIEKESQLFRNRLQHLSILKRKAEAQLVELKKQERSQRLLLQELQLESGLQAPVESHFSMLRGSLSPPVQADFKNHFGLKKESISNLFFIQSGLYFQTVGGEDVLSSSRGQVSFIGNLPYWGQIIILDHGEFYSTVYSNIENPSVRLGEQVNAQQKLAQVSNRKYDNRNGFYFEIRHYAEPQNPEEWLRPRSNN